MELIRFLLTTGVKKSRVRRSTKGSTGGDPIAASEQVASSMRNILTIQVCVVIHFIALIAYTYSYESNNAVCYSVSCGASRLFH